ncbi:hypothetical protein VTK56DRAFT_7251 [Thermocarpiscus australiensis]
MVTTDTTAVFTIHPTAVFEAGENMTLVGALLHYTGENQKDGFDAEAARQTRLLHTPTYIGGMRQGNEKTALHGHK